MNRQEAIINVCVLFSVAITQWGDAGTAFEEVGEGRDVVEVEAVGNLTNGEIGRAEQCAGLVIGKKCEMIVDCRARNFAHCTRQISGCHIEFVSIEADLSLFSEVGMSQMDEDFKDVFLVLEVVCEQAVVVRQLGDKQ